MKSSLKPSANGHRDLKPLEQERATVYDKNFISLPTLLTLIAIYGMISGMLENRYCITSNHLILASTNTFSEIGNSLNENQKMPPFYINFRLNSV